MECTAFDDRLEQALDLLVLGIPKTQIARTIGVHRNVIYAWCKRADFLRTLHERAASSTTPGTTTS